MTPYDHVSTEQPSHCQVNIWTPAALRDFLTHSHHKSHSQISFPIDDGLGHHGLHV